MGKSRGGKKVPLPAGIVTDFDGSFSVNSGDLTGTVQFIVEGDQDCWSSAWVAKNPGDFRKVFTVEDVSFDTAIDTGWDDGVTGQGYFTLNDANGELLYRSPTQDIVGDS